MKTFAELFAGYTKKHGRFKLSGEVSIKNKVGGRAFRGDGTPTKKDYERHLNGTGDGLGIVMLNDDGETVNFGAIDIDVYDGSLNYNALEKDIEKSPLVMIPSKSGGVHLYLFCAEPCPAELVQSKLAEWAAALGYGGCEIFPKQTQRLSDDDMGNWINLPYHGKTRHCYFKGKFVDLESFLKIANARLISPKQLYDTKVIDTVLFADGPPCLQIIAANGVAEGTRNDVLANMAVYEKMKHPATWEDELVRFNNSMEDPLPNAEIQAIIKSYMNKDYFYKCGGCFAANCDKRECFKREYGIGESGNELPIFLDSLTKVLSNPPLYWVNVNGARVEVGSFSNLVSQKAMQRICGEVSDKLLPAMKPARWQKIIQTLLDDLHELEAPEDASEKGQFHHYFSDYVENRATDEKDQMSMGNAWQDDGKVYFRSPDLLEHLNKRGFKITSQRLWAVLRDYGAEQHQFTIKRKNIPCWYVELSKVDLQTEEFDASTLKDPFEDGEEPSDDTKD